MAHLGVYMVKWIGFVFILETISKSVIHMCKRDGLIQGNLGVGSSICQNPCSTGVIQMLAVFVTHPQRDNLFTRTFVLGNTNLLPEHCVIYGDDIW